MNEVTESSPRSLVVSKEQLAAWIEHGYDENAVAVEGTSVENLRNIVQTGEFTPYLDRMTHKDPDTYLYRDLVAQGKMLYFAYPIFQGDNRYRFNTDIQEAFKDRLPDTPEGYAEETAFSMAFHRTSGVYMNPWELASLDFYLARKGGTWEETIKAVEQSNDIDDMDKFQKTIADLEQRFGREKVVEMLLDADKYKGALLYFNREIFNHQVELCPEGHDHIMIISDKPLPASAISGIRFLSDTDAKALDDIKTGSSIS